MMLTVGAAASKVGACLQMLKIASLLEQFAGSCCL